MSFCHNPLPKPGL